MNEVEFRNWMASKGINHKVICDNVSRLKRIEKAFPTLDIDEEYKKDKCKYLFDLFKKAGKNDEMKKYPNVNLPVGKKYMYTYRYALRRYIDFLSQTSSPKSL